MQDIIKPYFHVGLNEVREIVVNPVLMTIFLVQIILSVLFVVIGTVDEWMTSEPITWFVILVLIPFSIIRLIILFSLSFRSRDRFMTDLILVRGISRLEYFVGKIVAIYAYFFVESLVFIGGVTYFSREFSVPEANDINLVGLLYAYIIVLISFGLAGSTLSWLSASGLGTLKTVAVFFLILCIALPLWVLIGSVSIVLEDIFGSYGNFVRGLSSPSFFLIPLFLLGVVSTVGAYHFFSRRDF